MGNVFFEMRQIYNRLAFIKRTSEEIINNIERD